MTETTKEEAAELVKKSRTQAKHSVKNAGRAAKVITDPAVNAMVEDIDEVAEALHDAAERVEDTAEEAVRTAKRINPRALSALSSDMGIGFLAMSVSLTSAVIAANKFRAVYVARSEVLR